MEIVTKDQKEMEKRYQTAAQKRIELEEEVKKLEKLVAEKRKSLDVVAKEENWLEKKRGVRAEQIKMLVQRLKNGWNDEKSEV